MTRRGHSNFFFLCSNESLLLCGLFLVALKGGYSLDMVSQLLTAVASLVAEIRCVSFSGYSSWA